MHPRRTHVLALAVCATLGAAQYASAAAVSYAGGSVTLTHDPDIPLTTDPKSVKSPSVVPSSAGMPVPPSYHMKNTYSNGTGSTQAIGSFGHITNSSTASFTMVAGTGLTQSGGGFTGSSQLRMDFNLQWNVNSTFAPATAFVSLPVAYSVGTSAGDFSRFVANITWDDMAGTTWQNYVENTYFTTLGSSGVFTFNFNQPLGSAVLNAGTKIRMKGMIGFQANDADDSGVIPVNGEVGSAPPTFTFVPVARNANGAYDYNNAENWENKLRPGSGQQNPALHRARFLNQNADPDGSPTIVNIVESEAIHTLDIDSPNPYVLTGGPLVLDNAANREGGAALLNVRGVYGAADHRLANGLVLGSDVEMTIDSANPLTLDGVVAGAGDLSKLGLGGVVLTRANTFTGDLRLLRGTVDADAAGALGAGRTLVSAGLLKINAAGASSQPIEVNNQRGDENFGGGTVLLGVLPGPEDRFVVGAGGAIGVAPGGSLAVFTKANTVLAPGAMILHAGGVEGEPEVIAETSTPTYLYGVSGEGANPDDVEIGNGPGGGPWRGLGAGFGNSNVNGSFIVDGLADLVVSADGHLTVGATLIGSPGSILRKSGQGVAVLAGDNSRVAVLRVAQGGVLVNTDLSSAEIIVESDGALGGDGKVAKVTFEGGGILTPGNSPGTLSTGTLTLVKESHLNFDLDRAGGSPTSDFVEVAGDLVLDGTLNIFDGPDFGEGTYPLIHYTGNILDNGLEVGIAPQFNYFNEFFASGPDPFTPGDYFLTYDIDVIPNLGPAGGGTVFLNVKQSPVPEPATVSLLALGATAALRRRRRL